MKGLFHQGTILAALLVLQAPISLADKQSSIISIAPEATAALAENKPSQPSTTAIRALIKPLHEAILSNDSAAKITHISVQDGVRFKQGDVLVKFDCERYQAELAAAKAEQQARTKVHENNLDLARFDAVGKLELEVSKAQANKAMAEYQAVKARRKQCAMVAPWNGRVVEVTGHEHEVMEPGQDIIAILDDSSLTIDMIVPSHWLCWLKPDASYTMKIDETQKDYQIDIDRIGARVDPVSQTIRVIAGFKEQAKDVLAGMSGTVQFNVPE